MVTGDAKAGFAQGLVVSQIGSAAQLSAETNAVGENSREEKRVISNVGPDVKAGSVIGGLQRRQHLEKVVERLGLALDLALHLLSPRVFGQNLRDVIGDFPLGKPSAAKDMPDQDVKVK